MSVFCLTREAQNGGSKKQFFLTFQCLPVCKLSYLLAYAGDTSAGVDGWAGKPYRLCAYLSHPIPATKSHVSKHANCAVQQELRASGTSGRDALFVAVV